mmetsp:Transcript_22017/g.62585  ORF Transcript_22017/g.62585 Transcript_22017/m.62585 type:complete len:279 (-) Transcript_22017:61-897(-)
MAAFVSFEPYGQASNSSRRTGVSEAAPCPSRMVDFSDPLCWEVMAPPENGRCFDCDAELASDPWVSLSHGTVICLTCAGLHRSLGVDISRVKSLLFDDWQVSELEALRFGGNARFRSFLEEPAQSVPRRVWAALPLSLRYCTPAADLYRRRLQAQLSGAPDMPTELRRVVPPAHTLRHSASPRVMASGSEFGTDSGSDGGAPAWTPDDSAARCQLCKADFSLFLRRHHCRRCGRCVCDGCSPPECRRPLPDLGLEAPCRHCKACSPPAARAIRGLEQR